MALFIKDRIYVQITINGRDLPLDKLSILQNLHIVESVRTYLPQFSMTYTDATKFIASNDLLSDAAVIKVSIGADARQRVWEFRLFQSKDVQSDGGTVYTITGYLNVPKYWIESAADAYDMTASGVVKQIAATCGMTYEGLDTADSQLWIPHNTRYCEYARMVAERAWVDDQSCCQIAVLGDKRLRMFNVSEFDTRPSTVGFSNRGHSSSVLPVLDYNLISKGGFFNAQSGYQDNRVVQSLTTVDDGSYENINVKKNSRRLNMNKALKEDIEQSKVTFAPIDVGNVSETYEKALYQNRRVSNLYNFGADILTNLMVEANVLDFVTCELSKPDLTGIKSISGKFVLTSKVTYIEGMNFFQKCEVFRQGPNSQRDTTQV
jgi:hypothetical protein